MDRDVVLFTSAADSASDQLVRSLNGRTPPMRIVVLDDLDVLKARLRRYPRNIGALVLFAVDRAELRHLVELEPLFGDIPRLLVVYDGDAATAKLAHRLRPRLLAVSEDGVETVARVVDRILERK